MTGIWHTWLGYIGLVIGLISGSLLGWSILRSSLIGLAAGIAAAVVINLVTPGAAGCLQMSKGLDILRAYSLNCPPTPTGLR